MRSPAGVQKKWPVRRWIGHRYNLQLLSTKSDAVHGPTCLSKIPPKGQSNQPTRVLLSTFFMPGRTTCRYQQKSDTVSGLKSQSTGETASVTGEAVPLMGTHRPDHSLASQALPSGTQVLVGDKTTSDRGEVPWRQTAVMRSVWPLW